jgi:adenosine/AMP kinase
MIGAQKGGDQPHMELKLSVVTIEKPETINFVLGQSHFIKTVEDIHETLVSTVPSIRFGLAFCEASGACLVRWSGTDDEMIALAQQNAMALACGHCFILFLGQGFYPINILNSLKSVPEVARIYCATANPTQVIVAETEQGRGILGVIDGFKSKGIEDDEGINWRKGLLRKIGYKLG